VVVALPVEEFEAMMETLDVLSDPDVRLAKGKGDIKPLSGKLEGFNRFFLIRRMDKRFIHSAD